MKSLSKWIIANNLGTFLEYFDYTLYGFSVPLIADLFFPSTSSVTSQLLAWSAFSISFLIRPLGAILFGHYGDRLGRRKILASSILLMAISTTLLGLLPTYHQIGWLAAWLLIFCRLMQGFAISAEYNGSSIYLMEITDKYKGLLAASSPCASGLGMATASLLMVCFIQNTHNSIFSSDLAWRIPFVTAGLLVGGIGFYLRKNLPETPEFLIAQMQKELSKKPLLDALKANPLRFITSIILSAYTGTATYTILVFTATYLQIHLGMSAKSALLITAFVGLIESVFSPLFGWLSDVIKPTKPMLVSTIGMMFFAIPVFIALKSTHSTWVIISLLSLLAFLLAAFDGPLSSFLPILFPTAYRYSGAAVSFNIGGAMIGGFAPFLLSWLIAKTHNVAIPGFYLTGFAALSILMLLFHQYQQCSRGISL